MGVFIWHEWARYVGIFASVYTVWASIWGIFFRKFFWDFVNGTLQPGPLNTNGIPCFDDNPCGIVPAPGDAIFITMIVKAPVIQIVSLLFGLAHLGLELLPFLKKSGIYRSFVLRVVTYTLQTVFAVLFYQGVNGALYSFTAMIGFLVAQMKGEIWADVRESRGRGGGKA